LDALMGRSALPRTGNPRSFWLADLIEAMAAVSASAVPCDANTMKAFSHRLERQAEVKPLLGPVSTGTAAG